MVAGLIKPSQGKIMFNGDDTAGLHGARKRDYTLGVDRKKHTSELQSLMRISYAVFCLKKKKRQHTNRYIQQHNTTTTSETKNNNSQTRYRHSARAQTI